MDFMQAQVMMQGEGAGRGRELVSCRYQPYTQLCEERARDVNGPPSCLMDELPSLEPT